MSVVVGAVLLNLIADVDGGKNVSTYAVDASVKTSVKGLAEVGEKIAGIVEEIIVREAGKAT